MVSVTFVDAGSGRLIGHSEMPPDMLPETFEIVSALEISGSRYSVERAEPSHAAEFRVSGELTLFLRPIQLVPAEDIRYSLHTICDRLPQPDPSLARAGRFEMREDDWRQIEFVDVGLASVVEEQRRLIRDVVDNHSHRDSGGRPFAFDRLHVRIEPADPLPRGVSLRRVLDLIKPDQTYPGVGFRGLSGHVPGSFAFGAGSLVCYGLADGDTVKVLGLNEMPGMDISIDGTTLVNWLAI